MGLELTTLVVIGSDCTSSCKYNYHMITTTTAPNLASGHGETAKAQMNLPVSVTKTGQLRVSDTMFSRIHYKEHAVLLP